MHLPAERPVSDHFNSTLRELRRETTLSIAPKNDEEAEAWVTYLRLLRRQKCLLKMKLQAGDIVELSDGEKVEVSSIDGDGRVFFKGGRGYRSWPDLVHSVVARKGVDSASARKARTEAENAAAVPPASHEWSAARSEGLAEFAVCDSANEEDIDELEAVITRATNERPVQKFLEKNRNLLTSLLGGKERFCIPQKRLGSEYIPDFVIGDVNSLGVRWVLVELETPRCGIYLTDGRTLDKSTRKGVDQIIDWRHWLSQNIAYAHKPVMKEGLGLLDITNQSEALVIVGRRAKIPKTKDAKRRALWHENTIQVHSYDWLLERLRGAISHVGPPASNPHLISRPHSENDPHSRPR